MCGLEQQHHFLWFMSLTSHQFPEQEVNAKVKTQIRLQTHPAEAERDSTGKLATGPSLWSPFSRSTVHSCHFGSHVHASGG